MKIVCDFSEYTPREGAVYAYDKILEAGKIDELEDWIAGKVEF